MKLLEIQLQEKNVFLEKFYEYACKEAPGSPLSFYCDPIEFGKLIGFDENTTSRIVVELVGDQYATSGLGMKMFMITNYGVNYLRGLQRSNRNLDAPITINANKSTVQIQHSTSNSNIVNESQNLSIHNGDSIQKILNEIKEQIKKDETVDPAKVSEILECVKEIEQGIKNRTQSRFALKSLIGLIGDISSIAALGLSLSQLL
jgi:hypothetical protein